MRSSLSREKQLWKVYLAPDPFLPPKKSNFVLGKLIVFVHILRQEPVLLFYIHGGLDNQTL